MTLHPGLIVVVPLAAACALLPAAAMAGEASLAGCRALADREARLACYDALPLPPAAAPAAGALLPRAAAAAASLPPAGAADRFGLPERDSAAGSTSVRSAVAADFDGWSPGSRIRLLNGQVWQVVDGSSGVVAPSQRQVTVRRGALGSYVLEFEGLNRAPRVRRVE